MITQIGDSLQLQLPRLEEPREAALAFAGDKWKLAAEDKNFFAVSKPR